MQESRPLSPFGHRDGEAILLRSPGLVIEERAFVGKLSIRGRIGEANFLSRFRNVLGIDPPPPGSAVETDAATILPMGPTEWLAVGHKSEPVSSRSDADRLRARLITGGIVSVDVSSGTTILHTYGPDLHSTIRKLAALPLDRMPVGSVMRTRVGKLAILVHALAPDRADLFVARSFARSFFEQFQDAASPEP